MLHTISVCVDSRVSLVNVQMYEGMYWFCECVKYVLTILLEWCKLYYRLQFLQLAWSFLSKAIQVKIKHYFSARVLSLQWHVWCRRSQNSVERAGSWVVHDSEHMSHALLSGSWAWHTQCRHHVLGLQLLMTHGCIGCTATWDRIWNDQKYMCRNRNRNAILVLYRHILKSMCRWPLSIYCEARQ